MILGMGTASYTSLHVLISLIGIVSGLVVMLGLLRANPLPRWTVVFLSTTAFTSISGFGFPFDRLLPSHILGIMSLVVLAFAIPARYLFYLAGPWRSMYVIGSALALYFNFFVLIVQSFQKIPALRALAPTQKEPPFVVAQFVALIFFATLAVFATIRFHPEKVRAV